MGRRNNELISQQVWTELFIDTSVWLTQCFCAECVSRQSHLNTHWTVTPPEDTESVSVFLIPVFLNLPSSPIILFFTCQLPEHTVPTKVSWTLNNGRVMNPEEREQARISLHKEQDATSPDASDCVFVPTYERKFDSNWPSPQIPPLHANQMCRIKKKKKVCLCNEGKSCLRSLNLTQPG